jgi:DNA gyrase/topoisomerase IV subunit A
MGVADPDVYVIFITRDGKGKKVQPTEFSELLHRGAKGFKLVELGKNRSLASFALCDTDDMLLITTKAGRRIFIEVNNIQSNLLKLIEVADNDEVSSISAIKTQAE